MSEKITSIKVLKPHRHFSKDPKTGKVSHVDFEVGKTYKVPGDLPGKAALRAIAFGSAIDPAKEKK